MSPHRIRRSTIAAFEDRLRIRDRRAWQSLTTPVAIQGFLDRTAYEGEERYRSPLTFIRDRAGHCFDGALFAAAALWRIGYPPLLLDLLPTDDDDDHLLARFRHGRCWGALGKSNFSGIRYREPAYRTLRELTMSYFDGYFNVHGTRTLRAYTRPLDLRRFVAIDWMGSDARLDDIGDALNAARSYPLITRAQANRLTPVDSRSYRAGMLGVNAKGLYRP